MRMGYPSTIDAGGYGFLLSQGQLVLCVRAQRINTNSIVKQQLRSSAQIRDLAAQSARVLLWLLPSEDQRAQGMPGARSRAWCVVNTRVSHHGQTGTPGIPRAMVLTVSFALS